MDFFENWDISTYNYGGLFQGGKIGQLNACVGNNGGPYDFNDYSRGYFVAGARIVESLIKECATYPGSPSNIDILIYPLVFTFRHAIELGLKHLTKMLANIFEVNPNLNPSHKLIDTWEFVQLHLNKLLTEQDDLDQVNIVDKILKDFVQLDSKGETFRYPEARDGTLHLQNMSVINVQVFGEAMIHLSKVFDHWFFVVSHEWDQKLELMQYEREYQNSLPNADDMLWYGDES